MIWKMRRDLLIGELLERRKALVPTRCVPYMPDADRDSRRSAP
jgi:hypothetical protein